MITQSICDPLQKEIIEKKGVRRSDLLSIFEAFPWDSMLRKMKGVGDDQIYYSPSLGFADDESGKEITMSLVEHRGDSYVFYLFYAQKEVYKSFFGKKKVRESVRDIIDKNVEDSIQLIEFFRDAQYDKIDEMFSNS